MAEKFSGQGELRMLALDSLTSLVSGAKMRNISAGRFWLSKDHGRIPVKDQGPYQLLIYTFFIGEPAQCPVSMLYCITQY